MILWKKHEDCLFFDYHNMCHKYKFNRWNNIIWWRTTSGKTTAKITKIPTSPKELRKELRNRYHTKGTKNQKSASIPCHKWRFFIKWKEILYNTEKNLVDLLLYESSKVITEIEIDFSNEIYKPHPDDYKAKRTELTNNNEFYKKQLERRSSMKWHNLKKENETSPKEIVDKLATTLANSSGKPNMQKQSENLLTNYIIVDEKVESAKEKCEIRLLKEAPASVMDINTRFVTDN